LKDVETNKAAGNTNSTEITHYF